jgi:hypothetical protein
VDDIMARARQIQDEAQALEAEILEILDQKL